MNASLGGFKTHISRTVGDEKLRFRAGARLFAKIH